MSNQPAIVNSHRMEETMTESTGEDQSQPATNATVRILASRADAGFTQLHMSFEHLNDKIDHVESNLGQRIDNVEKRIDGVESNLSQQIDNVEKRIDGVESNLSQQIDNVEKRIDGVESNLSQQMNNISIEYKVALEKLSSEVKEKFAERAKSDKFLTFGFAITLLLVFSQMVVDLLG